MGKRVLLADDSATIQKLVKMALSGTSYELYSAFDGREALNKANEAAPDIVLADAIMPDMDGYDLCKAVKNDARLKNVPVVLLIGRFQPFDEERANEAGIDERMIKPFSASRLIETIENLLASSAESAGEVDEESMDATVNMSPEELAAHTSHWQHDQTAMTEDIPKIEDIEFDEDVAFDEDSATSDLSQADTMMLEDRAEENFLDDPSADGPMTMELSTEDLEDIDDSVQDFGSIYEENPPVTNLYSKVEKPLDDDVEELAEEDLLDDSFADFTMDSESDNEDVPIEDLDTGPLKTVETQETEDAPLDASFYEESDTQPVEPPTLTDAPRFGNDDILEEEALELEPEADDAITEDLEPSSATWEEIASPGEPVLATPDMPKPSIQPIEDEDLDATVAVSTGWTAPSQFNDSGIGEANSDSLADPEELMELDDDATFDPNEDLPFEESVLDQDSLLEEGDYEPLGSTTEEPLADALLVEEHEDPLDTASLDAEPLGTFLTESVPTEEFEEPQTLSDMDAFETQEGSLLEDAHSELERQEIEEPIADVSFDLVDEPTSFDEAVAREIPPVQPVVAKTVPQVMESRNHELASFSEDLLNQLADKVAERVLEKFERDTIREIAWEVIPELSEAIIKKRIFELERASDQS